MFCHRRGIEILPKKRHRDIDIEEATIYCHRRDTEIMSKKMHRDITIEEA